MRTRNRAVAIISHPSGENPCTDAGETKLGPARPSERSSHPWSSRSKAVRRVVPNASETSARNAAADNLVLTTDGQTRGMTLRTNLRKLGWAWLILAPIAIGVLACLQAGAYSCTAEIQTAPHPVSDVGMLCRALVDEKRIAELPRSESPIDLASMRIAAVSLFVTTLFGLIALLIGYKAFVIDRRRPAAVDSFGCVLAADAATAEVTGSIVASATEDAMLEDLLVEDGTGAILQRHPNIALAAGKVHVWQVLPPHATSPASLAVKGRMIVAGAPSSTFAAEFDLTTGCTPRTTTRTWP